MDPNWSNRPEDILLGASPAIARVREQIEEAGNSDLPILLTGESGTGKDLAALLLHERSRRRERRFVKVNCPAIPHPLFESELFGCEPGAFTGANSGRPGKFELANEGTLFLDEIGELSWEMQSKLLQALQDFQFVRLGGVNEKKVNVRLICGTNRKLSREIELGSFRADLYYRINVLHIEMPALRHRPGDPAVLMNHFIQRFSDWLGRRPTPLSSSILRILDAYHWPGNVRELENLAKRYVVLGSEDCILAVLQGPQESQPAALDVVDVNTPLRIQTKRALRSLERRIILQVLQNHKWNRRKTARSLDISYRALLYKIKEAGVPPIRSAPKRAEKAAAAETEE
jgi:two-component system response regulator AtoC